jgi:hypothetical protein
LHIDRELARCVTPSEPEANPPVTRLNRYIPNTPEEERRFRWWLHFFGGRATLLAHHVLRIEKEFQRELDRKSRSE